MKHDALVGVMLSLRGRLVLNERGCTGNHNGEGAAGPVARNSRLLCAVSAIP